ncbi:MAG: GatB/YqeY domain-containing protein [Pseudomonadota bacterium]|nr:GatB/YqeY domain-containing protein [Pseudomonadota bacterium]
MRTRINLELQLAEKEKNRERLSTLRLISAAIRDRDISVRCEENAQGVSDKQIFVLLSQMIAQRNRSVIHYQEAGRLEDAEREQAEIMIIQEFLPKQMTDEEMMETVYRVIDAEGASSIRDMSKVIGIIRRDYPDQMDDSKIVAAVKRCFSSNKFA